MFGSSYFGPSYFGRPYFGVLVATPVTPTQPQTSGVYGGYRTARYRSLIDAADDAAERAQDGDIQSAAQSLSKAADIARQKAERATGHDADLLADFICAAEAALATQRALIGSHIDRLRAMLAYQAALDAAMRLEQQNSQYDEAEALVLMLLM